MSYFVSAAVTAVMLAVALVFMICSMNLQVRLSQSAYAAGGGG